MSRTPARITMVTGNGQDRGLCNQRSNVFFFVRSFEILWVDDFMTFQRGYFFWWGGCMFVVQFRCFWLIL